MSKIKGQFGHYLSELPIDSEYLMIRFSPNSIPLKRRWKTNGLSANFISDYVKTFFIGKMATLSNDENVITAELENAVKYIANELLENAMKFSNETSLYKNRFALHLYEKQLIFKVSNSVNDDQATKLHALIQNLLTNDPNDLYIKQMEASASGEDGSLAYNGLGFLSMICDYSAQIGWEFGDCDEEPPVDIVTTMVCLYF